MERQPVNHDAAGYPALSATFDLTVGAKVGNVGDAEAEQRSLPRVVEPAQLAGPEEPARPDAGLLGDVTEIPRP